ncbi:His Kinase A (phospho-acceptor) domain-containing protein [Mameliella alba]|nr:amino acid-binding domain sensor hybrid histidine kinase [Mameliella alba]GGF78626.1 hypothetical protein GCM10011319_43580 [Mameliella alba]SDC76068.1 His Kinase A (phospho-acceptor) domain-containing protein [Mameliella alba]
MRILFASSRARWLLIGVFFLLMPLTAGAQSPERQVLRVPWAGDSSFGFVEADGTPRSFFLDLARMLAEEAGFEIDLVDVGLTTEVLPALSRGRADLLAGVGRGAIDDGQLLFAGPVAETRFVLFVRADAPRDWRFETFTDRRIGVLRNTVASRMRPPEGSVMVPYDDQVTAFAHLLDGQVDGVIVLSALGERTLRRTGLDGLVRPTFPPVRENSHFVALRPEFAPLLPGIEAALARLEDSGALDDLRASWLMVPPVPVPDVLTVGVSHFPPYHLVEEDGRVRGFAVEVLRDLAARADIAVQFEPITLESWARGPRAGAFDLLPLRSVTEAERNLLQFSAPIQTIEYAIFVRAADAGRELRPEEGRIGIIQSSPLRAEIAADLGVPLVMLPEVRGGAQDLRAGRIDALVMPRVTFQRTVQEMGLSDAFAQLDAPVFRNDLAIAMRPGLGDLQRRLDVVIRGYVGSDQYRDLARQWMEDPVFWTDRRVNLILYGGGALAILGALAFLVQNWRARANADRLRAQTALASERLAAILASTRQGVFGFGTGGEMAVINPGGRVLLGLEGDVSPQHWPESAQFLEPISAEPLDPGRDPLQRLFRGEMTNGQVCLFRARPDQASRYVRVTSDAVTSPGSGLSALMIVEDTHDNELNRQKLERSQRLSSLGMLTGGLAHDFNNILATILYNAQLIRMKAEGPLAATVDRIIDTVRHGNNLTQRLLGFSRQSPQEPGAVSLRESLKELESLARPAIGEAIGLILPAVDEDVFVHCVRGELENALLNLILNARDAMADSGQGDEIVIQVRRYDMRTSDQEDAETGHMVEIAVSDNGPGMTGDVLRQATDPFFSTKTDAGGTGLGLAMVDSLAARSSGRLSLSSEPGNGTTVRLRLPRVAGDGGALPQTSGAIPRGDGWRLLLVEDQAALREPMAELLRDLGYDVDMAETGRAALDRLDAGADYDVVLSDILMPGGVSGIDLARAICTRFARMAIVLMSGHAEVGSDEIRALGLPVLQKPCPLPDLAKAIHAALKEGQA